MGLFDFLLTDQMKRDKIATKIGLKTGIFVECPICRDVTEARNHEAFREQTEAYIRALVENRDGQTKLFGNNETEMIRTIAEVGKKLPYNCMCHI
ncbi:MAG: hypothetical protein DIZ77_05240 [endosymbiont of Seepiophila jonesi]|uniref:Uncharacterized protein n=1 Tax=endosymbiont of Lamellibrachia luymesi TaxID=2200907 RepID=A0A370D778_9GAMM|nr:MAG: hypothetical protein DIZ79_18880 [endosymbiont of Lamellibrachia luymesi]RDH93674.1 MAG: hypothetical protein DIZ77_05240 [endosymbiont of Seepiophila jonesi]